MKKEEVVKEIKSKESVGKVVGENVEFDRIRRITGYLVGTVDRFNNAKQCEEKDRISHAA